MKFFNVIFAIILTICFRRGLSYNYNLVSFEFTYETYTAVNKLVFNGANAKCSSNLENLEIFYFINTPENFNSIVEYFENEISGHLDAYMHKNGMKINIHFSNLERSKEEIEEGRIKYHITTKDLYTKMKFPDILFTLSEAKDADPSVIRNCVNRLQSLKNQNKSS